jgi:hypothetical protein
MQKIFKILFINFIFGKVYSQIPWNSEISVPNVCVCATAGQCKLAEGKKIIKI